MGSFFKASTLFALASILSTTFATSPACLLACVSQVEKSSNCDGLNDLSCVCGTLSSDVEQCLQDHCPNGDADSATSAFKSACGNRLSSNSSSSSAFSSTHASSSSSASSSASSSSEEQSSSVVVSASSSSVEETSAPASSEETSAASSSAQETSEAPSSVAAESSTLQTSSVAPETSASESAQPVVTQTEEAGAIANKVGLGAVVGLIGAALL